MRNLGENFRESGFFFSGKMAEYKINVAELGADFGIISAETEARKLICFEIRSDRFEAVVAATAAVFAIADLAEVKIEIVANDENVARI